MNDSRQNDRSCRENSASDRADGSFAVPDKPDRCVDLFPIRERSSLCRACRDLHLYPASQFQAFSFRRAQIPAECFPAAKFPNEEADQATLEILGFAFAPVKALESESGSAARRLRRSF